MMNYQVINLSTAIINSDLLEKHIEKNIVENKIIIFIINDEINNINSHYIKAEINARLKIICGKMDVVIKEILFSSEINKIKKNIRSGFSDREYIENLIEKKNVIKKCA